MTNVADRMPESAQFVYLNRKAFNANDAQPWAQAVARSGNSIDGVLPKGFVATMGYKPDQVFL